MSGSPVCRHDPRRESQEPNSTDNSLAQYTDQKHDFSPKLRSSHVSFKRTFGASALTIMGILAGGVEVRHGVVGVVLVLPPSNAEPLHQVTPENSGQVAVGPVLEDLFCWFIHQR